LGPRSVISSASYEARKFGVRSAMPSEQARRLCPGLILIPPSFADYSEISEKVFTKLKELAPVFQKVSIDEAYLDFSGCERLYPNRIEFGKNLKELVFNVSKLNCSVGIATNKMVAKIASDECKPNGLLEIPPGSEATFLAPLAIEKIPGIGKKTAAHLHAKGVLKCSDLAQKSDVWIRENIDHWGVQWRECARGISDSLVVEEWLRQSLSAEETFTQNIGDLSHLKKILLDLAEDIGFDLRRENLCAKTIQIKLRYPDFTTITRAMTLMQETDLTADIAETAVALLTKHKDPRKTLRLLGLKVSGLVDKNEVSRLPVQLDLFNQVQLDERRSKLESAKDTLRIKFGKKVFLTHLDKK
jgi:nucleotidyltransferase/DNA polymerase involved in DNA repair